jgi:ATP-dependent helicase/nuclease subunit A
LGRFLLQLSEFVARAPKEPLATTQSQGDVIRIMTIHYAKGLEFPLVVLPDMERPRHAGPSEPRLHADLGLVLPTDRQARNLGWELYRYIEDREDRDERMRLFYVACTRAADYLILSSSMNDLDKPSGDWCKLLAERFDLTTGEHRQELPEGYAAPRIRVTLDEPQVEGPVERPRRVALDKALTETKELIRTGADQSAKVELRIPVDRPARRRFSYSRLTAELQAFTEPPLPDVDRVGERSDHAEIAAVVTTQTASEAMEPRELGLLVHAVLQRLDFTQPSDVRQLCEFLSPQFATEAMEEVADQATTMINRFLESPRFEQLTKARDIRREIEFILPWPPGQPHADRYLQGVIDCLFLDADGKWRLIDYKTNRVTPAAVSYVAQQYELQLFVYSLACERALGTRPAECTLCFLSPGIEQSFEWNAASSEQAVARIDEAISRIASNVG